MNIIKRVRLTVKGYYAYPLTEEDQDLPNFQDWQKFDALLAEVKGGNFSRVPVLRDWIATADDWVLAGQYSDLLGNAGSANTLTQIIRDLPEGQDIVMEFIYGEILERWGHLSVIPVLIDLYERYSFSEDSMYIPPGLSRLMESTPGDVGAFPMEGSEDDIREYCQMARRRYRELCDRLGTDDAVVFRGDIIEIRNMCQRVLDDLGHERRFSEEMRHKFEAFTGVNCSGFYEDETLKPLKASAIIEEFLDNLDADKYQKGCRYFFGHRIPD
jgi:hypothetical protein